MPRKPVIKQGVLTRAIKAAVVTGHQMQTMDVLLNGQIRMSFVTKEKSECQSATKGQGSDGSRSEGHITSAGRSSIAAESAAQARQIANKLKRSSPIGSEIEAPDRGRVIPLKAS